VLLGLPNVSRDTFLGILALPHQIDSTFVNTCVPQTKPHRFTILGEGISFESIFNPTLPILTMGIAQFVVF